MERNGKGYDDKNNVIYDLKNGTGRIKDYNNNGKLIFEEHYLNGELNGKLKRCDYLGKIRI